MSNEAEPKTFRKLRQFSPHHSSSVGGSSGSNVAYWHV